MSPETKPTRKPVLSFELDDVIEISEPGIEVPRGGQGGPAPAGRPQALSFEADEVLEFNDKAIPCVRPEVGHE